MHKIVKGYATDKIELTFSSVQDLINYLYSTFANAFVVVKPSLDPNKTQVFVNSHNDSLTFQATGYFIEEHIIEETGLDEEE